MYLFFFSPLILKKAFCECCSSYCPCELLGETSLIQDLQELLSVLHSDRTVGVPLGLIWSHEDRKESLFPCIYPGVSQTVLPLICENHRVILFTFSSCSPTASKNQRLKRKGKTMVLVATEVFLHFQLPQIPTRRLKNCGWSPSFALISSVELVSILWTVICNINISISSVLVLLSGWRKRATTSGQRYLSKILVTPTADLFR